MWTRTGRKPLPPVRAAGSCRVPAAAAARRNGVRQGGAGQPVRRCAARCMAPVLVSGVTGCRIPDGTGSGSGGASCGGQAHAGPSCVWFPVAGPRCIPACSVSQAQPGPQPGSRCARPGRPEIFFRAAGHLLGAGCAGALSVPAETSSPSGCAPALFRLRFLSGAGTHHDQDPPPRSAWMCPPGCGQIQTSSQAGGITSARIRAITCGSLTGVPPGPKYRNPRPQRLRRIPPLLRSLRSSAATDRSASASSPANLAASTAPRGMSSSSGAGCLTSGRAPVLPA
jgi:hypothetical protein